MQSLVSVLFSLKLHSYKGRNFEWEDKEMTNPLFLTASCIARKPRYPPTEEGPDIISFPSLCFFHS